MFNFDSGPQGGAMDYEALIDRLIAEDDQKFARPLRCVYWALSVCTHSLYFSSTRLYQAASIQDSKTQNSFRV